MSRVQRIFLYGALAICVIWVVTPAFAQVKIESVSGRELVLSAGAVDGVKVGMTGVVKATMSAGGKMVTLDIASFKVTGVADRSSRAQLLEIGSGFTVDAGLEVGFDQALRPPEPDATAIIIHSNVSGDTAYLDGRRLGSTPQRVEVDPGSHIVRVEKEGYDPADQQVTVAKGKTKAVRAELTALQAPTPVPSDPFMLQQQAGEAFEGGRWEEAIAGYEALLRLVPNDPLAGAHLVEAKKRQEEARAEREEAKRRAEEAARRAEEMKRKLANAGYLMKMGDDLAAQGKWELAGDYYRQVAEVDGSYMDAGVKLKLAEIRQALGAEDNRVAKEVYLKLEGMDLPADLRTRLSELKGRISFVEAAGDVANFEPLSGMGFRYIPAGSFQMGSNDGGSDEKPVHRVRITRCFWMGETEVTQGQWKAVMGSNPSYFKNCGDDCPVEQVSWFDAVRYANELSKRAGLQECYRISGKNVTFVGLQCEGYRLPTEAEWEYAARAGKNHRYSGSDDLGAVAWYDHNSGNRTQPVGGKRANAWGLRDISGNVWECCWDWYGDYPPGSVIDPTGPASGSSRLERGGSWRNSARPCRSAYRSTARPDGHSNSLGFRLARTAP